MAAAATYEPIATTTLSSSAASYTFSSIPATYTDLRVVATVRRETAGSGWYVLLRCNGDVNSNYGYQMINMYAGSPTVSTYQSTSDTSIYCNYNDPSGADDWNLLMVDLLNYTSTTMYKSMFISQSGAITSSNGIANRLGGNWFSTAAVTSFTVIGSTYNLLAGSTLTLFGIKKA